MQVDYVLILAAGKGTRMGKIGESIPKVLWPVFSRSILELEVLHAKRYCKKQIFVNVYNYENKLTEHIKNSDVFKNVKVLYEEETLDIGGAIHNLAKQVKYSGKLLVINSDQFIMLTKERWKHFYELSNDRDAVLLTYDVYGKDLYNATIIENEDLVEVRKNNLMGRDDIHETYTGVSIVNLEKLEPKSGESKFFDSVANYKQKKIGAINIKESKYWDFGTIRRYYNSMFNILDKWSEEEPFIEFLKKNKILNESLITKNSYNSSSKKVINLGNKDQDIENTIYLSETNTQIPEQDCIVLDDLIEVVDLPSL